MINKNFLYIAVILLFINLGKAMQWQADPEVLEALSYGEKNRALNKSKALNNKRKPLNKWEADPEVLEALAYGEKSHALNQALINAVKYGNLAEARRLIRAGANPFLNPSAYSEADLTGVRNLLLEEQIISK